MGTVCGRCGEANRDAARFCAACGSSVRRRCVTCDAELPAGGRFCDECGAPAETNAAPGAGDQARKTLTVVFADVVGSTSMHERMDPESVRVFNSRCYAAMRAAVERYRGRVVKFVGDGMMAVFGVPEVAEDDAWRALAASADLHHELAGLGVVLRVGVNTGEVVVDEGDDDVVGDVVNVAARLEAAAPSGGVLVGEETYRLSRDLAEFGEPQRLTVKGRAEVVTARLLVSARSAPAGAEPGATFVGRDGDLARLVDALETVASTSRTQLVTVVGSPGVGKSRLLDEFAGVVGERALVLTGRCDSTAGTTAFAPIADVVAGAVDAAFRAGGGVDADVEVAVAFLRGDGEPGTPEQTFWGVRRALEAAAQTRPILAVLDDVHWAEPLLLDLVEHLAEWLGETPVLIVVAARPELRELRPALVEVGARPSKVIALQGLDADATCDLAAELLGAGGVPPALAGRLVVATDGNPLFVRELVRMLVDDGVLRASDDGWVLTVDESDIEVPPTISSLLAARIERLRADERTVLERASVLGHEVVRGTLVDLLPDRIRPQLDVVLESLRRKELLEPAGTYWVDEPLLRFHHALIRDAAYRRLLKQARAELHAQAATWIVGKTGGGDEYDELLGFHLEQAQANLRELGDLDDDGRTVAGEAADRLAAAARRALNRDDLPAAAALAARAMACLDGGDPARAELLLVRSEALLGAGNVIAAREAVDELGTLASGDERLAAWSTAFAVQVATLTSTADLEESRRLAREAAERLSGVGDAAGAAKAHRVHASVLARLGRVGDAEAALDRALTAARETADRRQISGVLAAAPLAALWGPSPVPRAGGRCLDVVRLLRMTTGAREVEAISTRCQALLEAFRGRHDAARTMIASARRTLEDLGLPLALLELDMAAGLVELTGGEPVAAQELLTRAYDGFRAMGVDADAGQAAALAARAALAVGEDDEALMLADTAAALGGGDLKTAIAWRAVKAEVLARQGDAEAAELVAREAVSLAAPTDALVDHADALAALAVVLSATGDRAGARAANRRALELYEQKGATALAARLGVSEPHAAPDEDLDTAIAPPASESAIGTVQFGPDDLAAAVAELDRLAAGPVADNMAVRGVRAADQLVLARAWDEVAAGVHPDYVYEDRRPGLTARVSGREAGVANIRAGSEQGLTDIDHEVLATRGDRAALLRTFITAAGYDLESLLVVTCDERGLATRCVHFDASQLDGAIAELDRLANQELARRRDGSDLRNRATATWFTGQRLAADGRFDELDVSPVVEFEDRQPGLPVTVEASVDDLVAAVSGVRYEASHVIAVRGESLALIGGRSHAPGSDFVGENLWVVGVDDDGMVTRVVIFGVEQIADALWELDERYSSIAARISGAYGHAINTRDWDRAAATLHSDVVYIDHRPVGFGETVGVDTTVERIRSLVEVAEDQIVFTRAFLDERGDVALSTIRNESKSLGTHSDALAVMSFRSGRIARYELFTVEDTAAARRRFEQLAQYVHGA